ncbi:MAG TPA: acyl-CoA dehydrogenase family protein [Mycobacteriales bacterium]|jgi:alkylation response protein AidB-like acyl-CoA dehydrogenase|nr:acyl-CoA dehydrogenase family protein [Mycobacteriales bacterium]HVU60193.1 acyl-CoA dehydrogenase family protein [Mycobacteriales bacterium]
MRLAADQDALDFAESIAELLADVADAAALRAAWDDPDGRIPGVWKRLAETGLLGLTVPEQYGGSGADLTTLLPALIELGRAALPEPVVETVVGATLLARCGGDLAAQWLPRVVAGDAVIAVGLGPGSLISAAPWADLVLVQRPDGTVVAAPREAASLTEHASVDRGMRFASVAADDGAALTGADPGPVFDLGAVAYAALLTGGARAMLEMSVDYARQREQFGVPIGSFQAIKHQLANVYVGTVFALPVVARGAWSVAHDVPTRSRDASHAKHIATVSAQQAARTALQVHAGIGYTYEHDLHMWMKRTWTLSSLWGTAAWHKARVAKAVLEDA